MMEFIENKFSTLEQYVSFFSKQQLPVLEISRDTFAEMAELQDQLSARQIAATVLHDPLAAMQLIAYLEKNRRVSQNHDITTVERAIMMIGVEPFFQHFKDLPAAETLLAGKPEAIEGLLRVANRAQKAAKFARDWASYRHDLNIDEITLATLLHDATEVVCWCFAPKLTGQIYHMQSLDPSLRTATAQREVFGHSAQEIQQALVSAWSLPELLVTLLDESHEENPRVLTVKLANQLARHLEHGWDNPAIPDDLAAIRALLHIHPAALLRRIGAPHEMIVAAEQAQMPDDNPSDADMMQTGSSAPQ